MSHFTALAKLLFNHVGGLWFLNGVNYTILTSLLMMLLCGAGDFYLKAVSLNEPKITNTFKVVDEFESLTVKMY